MLYEYKSKKENQFIMSKGSNGTYSMKNYTIENLYSVYTYEYADSEVIVVVTEKTRTTRIISNVKLIEEWSEEDNVLYYKLEKSNNLNLTNYFGRPFVCKIDGMRFTVYKDIYNDKNELIILRMKVNKEQLNKLNELEGKEILFEIVSIKTIQRPESSSCEDVLKIMKVPGNLFLEPEVFINVEVARVKKS